MIAVRRYITTSLVLGLGLAAIVAPAASSAQKAPSSVAARVTAAVDNNKRTTLTGHVRPFLARATDNGAVDDTQKTGPIMLMFSRTPQQQADLDSAVDQLHNKNSAQFHQWLTPQQFGARFEPADSDVAAVKTWLVSQGFTVLDVVPSKAFISFEGTTGQLRAAFKTEIHHVSINGEAHMAAINEPSIPTALALVIGGLNKLDDFGGKPLFKPMGAFSKNIKTGKVTQISGPKPVTAFTTSNANGTLYQVGPQDFYTIYNENPLLQAGITGAGQTIAVIEETQVNPADVTTFRTFFGLPTYPATPNATAGGVNYLYGTSTGLSGYASCFAPNTVAKGKTSGDEGEADIDLQWAGAVAPNAIVDYVGCGGTKTSPDGTTLGALGIDHAAQYIVNYLSSTVGAASMSYGECEADMSSSQTSGVGYYNNQWEQYAAEGITAIISSGDGGAEQCYQNGTDATTLAPSVNGFGSSAYNVSAGGTDFGDAYETNNYSTSPASTWWNTANGTGQSSAIAYVPETTWAGYCSSQLFVSSLQANASTTLGTNYTTEGVCSNATAKTDGYVAVVGGAGGISTYNTIPTWQSVYGVGINSVSSTYRNLPDVSLYASNGFWGHLLPYCESDEQACTLASYAGTTDDLGAGGTSFVAPQLAGFMALVNQKTGSHQGQANYTFYSLAAQQYGTPGSPASSLASCSGSGVAPGQSPASSCFFNDISNDMPSLQGGTITAGNYQPCLAADANCYKGTGTTYGVNVVPGTTATAGILGYTASPGYDDATGIGSLNITNVVQGWNSVTSGFASTTALTASSTKIAPTASTTLTATVVASGRGGTVAPAGLVNFYIGSATGTSLGSGTIASSCTGTGATTNCKGVATLSVAGSALTTGSNSIVGIFSGDGANDAASTSTATIVQVYGQPVGHLDLAVAASTGSSTVAQNDTLFTGGWAADAVDGSSPASVKVLLDGVGTTPTLGISRPDVVSATGNSSYATSGWQLSYAASGLSLGTHTVALQVTNGGGLTLTTPATTITVVVAPTASPVGHVDTVEGASSLSTTIPQSDTVFVGGWAADPKDGSPLSNVVVLIDGSTSYTPTLGLSRPDVVSATGNAAYQNSGFSLAVLASTLSLGNHTVSVTATNSSGLSTTLGSVSISVVAGTVPPIGHLDLVADNATASTTTISQEDLVFVSGWAADYATNGNVATVTIYADGNPLATATLGQSRPDVATAYNDPSWSNTGFVAAPSASSLSLGSHTISVIATDHGGLLTTLGSSTVTITP